MATASSSSSTNSTTSSSTLDQVFLAPKDARRYPIDPAAVSEEVKSSNYDTLLTIANLFKEVAFQEFIGEQPALCAQLAPLFVQAHQAEELDDATLHTITGTYAAKGTFLHESLNKGITLWEGDDTIATSRTVLYMRFPELWDQLSSDWSLKLTHRGTALAIYKFIHANTDDLEGSWGDIHELLDVSRDTPFLKPLYTKIAKAFCRRIGTLSGPAELLEFRPVLQHFDEKRKRLHCLQQAVAVCFKKAGVHARQLKWHGNTAYFLGCHELYLLQRDDELGEIFRSCVRGIDLGKEAAPSRRLLALQKKGPWAEKIRYAHVAMNSVGSDFVSLRALFPNLGMVFLSHQERRGRGVSLSEIAKAANSLGNDLAVRLTCETHSPSDTIHVTKAHVDQFQELINQNISLQFPTQFGLEFKSYLRVNRAETSEGYFSSKRIIASSATDEVTELLQKLMPHEMEVLPPQNAGSWIWQLRPQPGAHAAQVEIVDDDGEASSSSSSS